MCKFVQNKKKGRGTGEPIYIHRLPGGQLIMEGLEDFPTDLSARLTDTHIERPIQYRFT